MIVDEITMHSNVAYDPKVQITIKSNSKTFNDAEIEDFYHQYFSLTKNYPNSKRRSDFVAFAKAVLEKAQEK
jgi:hypothetical protein